MRAGIAAAIIAMSVLSGSAAWCACAPSRSGNCVDLDLVPQISQQIVADEHIAIPPKTATRPDDTSRPYTGPTVGAAQNLRRAPTVGYRWSLD